MPYCFLGCQYCAYLRKYAAAPRSNEIRILGPFLFLASQAPLDLLTRAIAAPRWNHEHYRQCCNCIEKSEETKFEPNLLPLFQYV
jgi:hypothetical protein